MNDDDPTLGEKISGIGQVARFDPTLAMAIVAVNLFTALFEGVGLGLLFPIIETAQTGGESLQQSSGVTGYFFDVYEFLGVPFTFETLIIGVAAVMTVRFGLTFLTTLLQVKLRTRYIVHLRERCFDNLLNTELSFVESRDDDEIINTIITEIGQSSGIINRILRITEQLIFIAAYTAIALLIAPMLTVAAVVTLGGVAFVTRYVIKPGYGIGSRVADVNEEIQSLVTASAQGIREIKLYNMAADLFEEYREAHATYEQQNVSLARNQAALTNINRLFNAFALFALVYVAISYLELSFASLGVFLLAMFRLSPQLSSLNDSVYTLDGNLPHLLRCHRLIADLGTHAQPTGSDAPPDPVTTVALDDVSFRYGTDEDATDVRNVSLRVERGETVALVGASGAGKSTIVSLIARLYDPDEGRILVNGRDLTRFDVDAWHERVAIVPQHPFIFNDSLRYNVAIGKPDASEAEIRRVCEISQITEFLDELPNGLDSQVGDDAVRLSGGQRQRVAIARALLADADILLLDEATSELDSPTEEAIVAGIDSMDREYLTVVVGHWLSTVRDADRIYTIVNGELAETGTHQELIEADSHYADLYGSQTESITPE